MTHDLVELIAILVVGGFYLGVFAWMASRPMRRPEWSGVVRLRPGSGKGECKMTETEDLAILQGRDDLLPLLKRARQTITAFAGAAPEVQGSLQHGAPPRQRDWRDCGSDRQER